MLASDQDRLAQAIFADHRHYSFELAGKEGELGEAKVIQLVMDELAPGLYEQWRASKQEAGELGIASSLRLFMWQHMVLESPARFLRLLEGMDRPWVVDAPVLRVG